MKKSRLDKKASRTSARAATAAEPILPKPPADRLLSRLRAIVAILEGSTLAELRYEDEEMSVELSRHSAAPQAPAHAPAPRPALEAEPTPEKPKAAPPADLHVVRSPFIGTFYSAASPDAEPFVEVGGPVRRGQTLCIVEAMKLMNEIESEVDGTVLEVLAENGKAVQYGDELFKIKKR